MTNDSPRILYVDTEIDQRPYLAAMLEYRGFRVSIAKRALDALQLIVTEHFHIVLIDYELPDMPGAQLAQEIRTVEPQARVILFSGRPHLPAGELAFVDVHIVKGSLLDTIIETVRGLLQSLNLTPYPVASDRTSSTRCSVRRRRLLPARR